MALALDEHVSHYSQSREESKLADADRVGAHPKPQRTYRVCPSPPLLTLLQRLSLPGSVHCSTSTQAPGTSSPGLQWQELLIYADHRPRCAEELSLLQWPAHQLVTFQARFLFYPCGSLYTIPRFALQPPATCTARQKLLTTHRSCSHLEQV